MRNILIEELREKVVTATWHVKKLFGAVKIPMLKKLFYKKPDRVLIDFSTFHVHASHMCNCLKFTVTVLNSFHLMI